MADEKLAFEAMMNEIEESDSDHCPEEMHVPVTAGGKGKRSKRSHHHTFSKGKEDDSNSFKTHEARAPLTKKTLGIDIALPKDQHEFDIDNFGAKSVGAFSSDKRGFETQAKQDDFVKSKNWLMRPCHPHDPTTQCFMIREKNIVGGMTLRLYVEGKDNIGPKFLMSAKKIINKRTSYYLISILNEPEERGGDDVLGKMRANGVGSKYLITDHGLAPDKAHAPSTIRKEHGFLKFKFDSDSPTAIQAFIPLVNMNGVAVTFQPKSEADSIEQCVERNETCRLLTLVNKVPKWDATQKGHVLNFEGRVTKSSVKNFQLTVNDCEEICMQFGRVDKDKFTMDVKYPLSLFQAFGFCLATMDKKIADRQGYSFVKKMMSGKK